MLISFVYCWFVIDLPCFLCADSRIIEDFKLYENLTIKDFEIKVTLGTGSFGRVVLAKHNKTGIHVAIKILKKEKVVKTKQIEHTKYEKNLLLEIDCPFVVNLLTTFQDSKNLYLVMEYVKGGEMFFHLRKAGR